MALTISGAFTALITPFDDDGNVDVKGLSDLVERQIEGGIDGLVPCGTTGESATMTEEERLAVIARVAEVAAGRVRVVAGTGSNDTRASIAFTRRAAEISGVDAALVVTPYYNKPNQAGLARHFRAIADAGGLPLVLYNVPGRTSVCMSAETVASLAAHPEIIAIKEATGDMILGTRILELVGENLSLLSGDDFTSFPLMAIGAQGCISVVSNIAPETMSALCAAANAGDLSTARGLHRKIQPLSRALFADTNPVLVKTAAHLLGWCGPTLRAPLYTPDASQRELLRAALDAYGLPT